MSELNKKYDIKEKLGYGAFGVVFSAVRKDDDEHVAIKVTKKKSVYSWNKDNLKKIPSEIDTMLKCKKIPGVVQLEEWYFLSDYYIIIMSKPTQCMDLGELIEKYDKLNENLARFIFQQIVITVKYCMKNDVVHKDIKMENIVIDMETGKTILIDFGAATSRNIKTKEIQGTVGYVPPEWFLYEMYLDEPGTVWSLGILLYGMLKGTLPFSTEYEICTQRIEKMAQMQDLTSDAQHLIENCLEFDFSSRFSFEEILKSNWMKESTLSWNQLISNS